ncbi:MAG: acyltransferase [Bdellovibrionales bacterium]|nr:acyltransferase [Bdellovibrionales bacterium]
MNARKSNLLPGLNGLRFFAAFAVIVHHLEQIKMLQGLPNRWVHPMVLGLGDQGVTFFFVLSGFLITYLLCEEMRASGTIGIKNFYLRRALRIWPVYYLLTFLGFFVLPFIPLMTVHNYPPVWDGHGLAKLAGYLLLSAHITERFIGPVVFAGALWSTSIEEHFYLIWPHLVRFAKNKLPLMLLAVGLLDFVLKNLPYFASFVFKNDQSVPAWVPGFLQSTALYFFWFRIDCMAIGGMGAWLYLNRKAWLWPLFLIPSQILILLYTLYRLYTGLRLRMFDDEIYAFLFMAIIVNVALNPKSILKLRNRFCEFMGKISFGLYAYNWIGITLVLNSLVALKWVPENFYAFTLLANSLSLAVIVGMSALSYFYFEKRFLKLKKYFPNSAHELSIDATSR